MARDRENVFSFWAQSPSNSEEDVQVFRQFSVHPEFRTVCWPNGADFAPEFLYEAAARQIARTDAWPRAPFAAAEIACRHPPCPASRWPLRRSLDA
ncbi:MAG: DUF2442 domain-containing protein [Gammaproteobacteria bacterium]